ncbi:hypothetical protein MGH68_17030 [Erysipelothrix sp. D19-032]
MWEILGIDATTDIEQIFEAYASKVAENGESDALTKAYEDALVYAKAHPIPDLTISCKSCP